jgi:hypothetical protein
LIDVFCSRDRSPATGCTPDELWDHLSCRHHQPPSVIDTGMKSFLWGQLLNCTSLMKLYHIPHPAPLQGPLNQLLLPDGTTRWNEYLPVHQYMYISEEGGKIKGSCSTYCERRDITDEILSLSPDEQSLTKIHEKSATHISIVKTWLIAVLALYSLVYSKVCQIKLILHIV